jgi:predicted transcriptional regulator
MEDDLDDEVEVGGDTLRLTVDVVASFVANHSLPADQIPGLIRSIHRTLDSLARGEEDQEAEARKPAVPVNKSVHNDFIICLEDGKKLKMLKRYLRSTYDLSPEQYRKRWGLPPDYPMVAPNYSARRSESARRIGLGKGVRRRDGA